MEQVYYSKLPSQRTFFCKTKYSSKAITTSSKKQKQAMQRPVKPTILNVKLPFRTSIFQYSADQTERQRRLDLLGRRTTNIISRLLFSHTFARQLNPACLLMWGLLPIHQVSGGCFPAPDRKNHRPTEENHPAKSRNGTNFNPTGGS